MIRRTCCVISAVFMAICAVVSAHDQAQAADVEKSAGVNVTANSIGMKMVLVPAGEFMMGNSHEADEESKMLKKYNIEVKATDFKDEYPSHRVRITRPFYLGACPVTVGQFRKFVKDTHYKTDAEKGGIADVAGSEQTDDHPVVNVSWNDAVAFCQWLSRKENRVYRLPTEAEWEYACRAGTTTRYYNVDDPEGLTLVVHVADRDATPRSSTTIHATDARVLTPPVATSPPNALGLYDMLATGWQWCADWYAVDYYQKSLTDDPMGPDYGPYRVLRGGSRFSWLLLARASDRTAAAPTSHSTDVGFRVVYNP